MIIIISSKEDAHLPFVTKHLRQDYMVVDASTIVNEQGLSYIFKKGHLTVTCAGEEITDVDSVWVRKPGVLGLDIKLDVAERFREYSEKALGGHLKQLYGIWKDALWVSDRYAIERAENKIFQLTTAQEVGLRCPDTVITSIEDDARQLIESQPISVVKPISRSYLASDKKGYYKVFFATKVHPNESIPYNGLHLAPCIFQEGIEPDFDIRATVIGDQVFAAKLTLPMGETGRIRDWHIGDYQGGMDIQSFELPLAISKKCVQLIRKLGLTYGAIDFVQDKQGAIWFLEINPNGQWAFVEEKTGQPIGKALAAFLDGRVNHAMA